MCINCFKKTCTFGPGYISCRFGRASVFYRK